MACLPKSETAHLDEHCLCGAKFQGRAVGSGAGRDVERLREAFWAIHVGEGHGETVAATARRARWKAEGRVS